MADRTVRKWVYAGLLTAVVALTTGFFKIPLAVGYVHLGDGAIYLCALLMGPIGWIPAAVGSALADLMAGYALYIPASALIKGLTGFFAGKYLRRGQKNLARNLRTLLALSALMVGGYFVWSCLCYGVPAALGEAAGNLAQAAAGIALGLVAATFADRIRVDL